MLTAAGGPTWHVRWGDQLWQGGTNCGSRTWSGGTIGGAVFGPAGPLAARTTCGVTGHVAILLDCPIETLCVSGYSDTSYPFIFSQHCHSTFTNISILKHPGI